MRIILHTLAKVESRSEMLEIQRVIRPTLPRYLINIGDRVRIRMAFQRLL